MKGVVSTKREDLNCNHETEITFSAAHQRNFDKWNEITTVAVVPFTSEEVVCGIQIVTDTSKRQLRRLCYLTKELRGEYSSRNSGDTCFLDQQALLLVVVFSLEQTCIW